MRLRLTTHLPIDGTRIGLTVWWGSVEHGWTGKTLRPSMWFATWRITVVKPDDLPAVERNAA